MARSIGNHRVDSRRLRKAILEGARRHYREKGVSEADLTRRFPLLLPPPPGAVLEMPSVGEVKTFALVGRDPVALV